MRRTRLVLVALAVMVAVLVIFSAPALADKNNKHKKHHGDRDNNNDVVFVLNSGFGGFHDDDFEIDDFEIDDFEIDLDDGDDFSVISPFFAVSCWEWSWVFERWEWECD